MDALSPSDRIFVANSVRAILRAMYEIGFWAAAVVSSFVAETVLRDWGFGWLTVTAVALIALIRMAVASVDASISLRRGERRLSELDTRDT